MHFCEPTSCKQTTNEEVSYKLSLRFALQSINLNDFVADTRSHHIQLRHSVCLVSIRMFVSEHVQFIYNFRERERFPLKRSKAVSSTVCRPTVFQIRFIFFLLVHL